jgi:hypothetical protein
MLALDMAKDKFTLNIAKTALTKALGSAYRSVLSDAKKDGLIEAHEEFVSITFDKSKAIHLQALLEFYGVKDVPYNATKTDRRTGED